MVLFSSDISQQVGGQLAMFSNQAQYAQQVGAMAGTGPQQMGGGPSMVAPNFGPSYARAGYGGQDLGPWSYNKPGGLGAAITTGIGGMLPGMASGASLAGGLGLMGHMGGYMDPFTGVGRAFMGGAGGMSGIGGAFAQGGMRAGLGAIGGGLAAAALPLAGYYAAGQAISTVGENIAQGARNITQVGQSAQQFMGPSYGMGGARPGGGLPRAEIQGIVSALHEIAGQDVMSTMESVKRLMSQASTMGMLTGVTDAASFKQKFSRVVDQVKSVAKIMGTTLEEAAPLLGQMQSMGMWKASDILGTASALQQVGRGGQQQLMGAMQAGAQGSWQQGGTLAAGANLARNQFLNVQAMMRSGAMSNEQLMEFTGGVGGAEGQQMMAQNMTGMMQRMGRVPVGRALMAGLGEQVNGRFTGRIDTKRLGAFESGNMSLNDVMSQGYSRTRTREQAASYTAHSDQMGQELSSQGGMELVGQTLNQIVERAGYGKASDDIKQLFLQNMLGMNQREAQQWMGLLKDMPKIMETKSRRERDQLRDAFRRVDETQHRSWEGLKRAVGHAWEESVERPLQEVGERLTTGINERIDSMTDYIYGRTRQNTVSGDERVRLLMRPDAIGDRFKREPGDLARSFMRDDKGIGERAIGMFGNERSKADLLRSSGIKVTQFPGSEIPKNFVSLGAGTKEVNGFSIPVVNAVRADQADAMIDRMVQRAENPTLSGLGFRDDSQSKADLETLKSAYRRIVSGGGTGAEAWMDAKDKSPEERRKIMRGLLADHPGAQDAIQRLMRTRQAGGAPGGADDLMAAIEGGLASDLGYIPDGGTLLPEAKEFSVKMGLATTDEANKYINSSTKRAYEALLGTEKTAETDWVEDMLGGFTEDRGQKRNVRTVKAPDIRESEFAGLLNDPKYGSMLRDWIDSGLAKEPDELLKGFETDDKLKRARNAIMALKSGDADAFKRLQEGTRDVTEGRRGLVRAEDVATTKRVASQELASARSVSNEGVRKLSAGTRQVYEDILELYAKGDEAGAEEKVRMLGGIVGQDEARILSQQGAAGGKIANIRSLTGLTKGKQKSLTEDQIRSRLGSGWLTAIEASPDAKAEYEKLLGGVGKGGAIDMGRIKEFETYLEKRQAAGGLGETKKGAAAENDFMTKLMGQLTGYTESNARFVTAVGIALGGDSLRAADETAKKNLDKQGTNPSGSAGEGTYGGH